MPNVRCQSPVTPKQSVLERDHLRKLVNIGWEKRGGVWEKSDIHGKEVKICGKKNLLVFVIARGVAESIGRTEDAGVCDRPLRMASSLLDFCI